VTYVVHSLLFPIYDIHTNRQAHYRPLRGSPMALLETCKASIHIPCPIDYLDVGQSALDLGSDVVVTLGSSSFESR